MSTAAPPGAATASPSADPAARDEVRAALRELRGGVEALLAAEQRKRVRDAARPERDGDGTTRAGERALVALLEAPRSSAGELAGRLGIRPATLAATLGRLEAADLVARTRDPGDRRRALLQVTPAGRAVAEARLHHAEATWRAEADDVDGVELVRAAAVLRRVAAVLDRV